MFLSLFYAIFYRSSSMEIPIFLEARRFLRDIGFIVSRIATARNVLYLDRVIPLILPFKR